MNQFQIEALSEFAREIEFCANFLAWEAPPGSEEEERLNSLWEAANKLRRFTEGGTK